jgi:hypothetical protein
MEARESRFADGRFRPGALPTRDPLRWIPTGLKCPGAMSGHSGSGLALLASAAGVHLDTAPGARPSGRFGVRAEWVKRLACSFPAVKRRKRRAPACWPSGAVSRCARAAAVSFSGHSGRGVAGSSLKGGRWTKNWCGGVQQWRARLSGRVWAGRLRSGWLLPPPHQFRFFTLCSGWLRGSGGHA